VITNFFGWDAFHKSRGAKENQWSLNHFASAIATDQPGPHTLWRSPLGLLLGVTLLALDKEGLTGSWDVGDGGYDSVAMGVNLVSTGSEMGEPTGTGPTTMEGTPRGATGMGVTGRVMSGGQATERKAAWRGAPETQIPARNAPRSDGESVGPKRKMTH
jgi:hypothetical protein